MSPETEFKPARARFVPQSGADKNQEMIVHFNPLTLQYTVSNTMGTGQGNRSRQYVSQSTGKLTMDLIFDSTSTGEDVRTFTEKIANFMKPGDKKIPPIILFEWGTYKFQGMADSYRETLDFFAENGVPLRASINLTLARQDHVFDPSAKGSVKTGAENNFPSEPLDVPASPNNDVTSVATRAGAPRAARAIAENNNLASLRDSGGGSLSLSGSIQLGGPVAFSSGASLGGAAGLGLSGKASGSAGVSFGASASAGISASAGAFSGLRSSDSASASINLDLNALIPRHDVAKLATDSGASFQVGGKAILESSSSLAASVNGESKLTAGLRFDE